MAKVAWEEDWEVEVCQQQVRGQHGLNVSFAPKDHPSSSAHACCGLLTAV